MRAAIVPGPAPRLLLAAALALGLLAGCRAQVHVHEAGHEHLQPQPPAAAPEPAAASPVPPDEIILGEAEDGQVSAFSRRGFFNFTELVSTEPALLEAARAPRRCRSRRVLSISWGLYMRFKPGGDAFTVPCGTTIRFDWTGEYHGVALVPSFACPSDPEAYQPIAGGDVSQFNTVASYKTTTPGETLYFACQVPGHCQSGQIIKVRVIPSA